MTENATHFRLFSILQHRPVLSDPVRKDFRFLYH